MTSINDVNNGLTQVKSSAAIGVNENQAELILNIEGTTAVCTKKAWVLGEEEYSNLGNKTVTVSSIKEIFEFFGDEWLAQNLYELAGIAYNQAMLEGSAEGEGATLTPIGPEVLNFIEKIDDKNLVNNDKEIAGVYYINEKWVTHTNSLSSNKQTINCHPCVKTKQFFIQKDGEVFTFSTRQITICKSLDEIGRFFDDNRMGQLVYKNLLNNQH